VTPCSLVEYFGINVLAESAAANLKADDQEGKGTDDTQRKGNRKLVVATESMEEGCPKNRQVCHSSPLLQYRTCTVSRMHLTGTARVVPKHSRR